MGLEYGVEGRVEMAMVRLDHERHVTIAMKARVRATLTVFMLHLLAMPALALEGAT